jgi:hypothetical protein
MRDRRAMLRPDKEPQLIRVARGCWIDRSTEHDLHARCVAAIASSAEYTVVAVTTAGHLHGLWLSQELTALHLATATPGTRGRAMTRTRRHEFVPHRYQLAECDIVVLGGLLVTSLARTWRDLADVLSLPDLVAAGDSALRLGAEPDELAEVIDRTPRRPFTARARAAFTLLDKRSRSRPESHMRVAVSAPDLPRFEVNVPVGRSEGGWLGEPDLSLEPARLGLEYQGEDHAELRRMRKDLTRFTDFRRDKWLLLPYGPAEVFGRPWEIEEEVRIAIAQRAPQLLRGRRRRLVGRVVSSVSSGQA